MNKDLLIERLELVKHIEGGYFARTYQSQKQTNGRALSTSIYYMLTDDSPIGHFHINQSDILHFFHLGSPITYLTISPEGQLDTFILGNDITKGHLLQKVVLGGYWKASILEQGTFGLISEAVCPGFDYSDMRIATPDQLRLSFPDFWDKIKPYVKSKE